MKANIVPGCIGCGLCENTCPEVFRLGDDGLVEVYGPVEPDMEDAVTEAAEGCPVGVIETE